MAENVDLLLKQLEIAKKVFEVAKQEQEEAMKLVYQKREEVQQLENIGKPDGLPLELLQQAILENMERKVQMETFHTNHETKEFEELFSLQSQQSYVSQQKTYHSDDKITPTVKLSIKSSSDIRVDGYVDVMYDLSNGEWDDSDCLCLVDSILYQNNPPFDSDSAIIYEFFEYTSLPKRIDHSNNDTTDNNNNNNNNSNNSSSSSSNIFNDIYRGRTRIPLQSYGGDYRIAYVRKSRTLNKIQILALSDIFSFPAIIMISANKRDLLQKRRSAQPIESNISYRVVMEDLQNISVMNISFEPKYDNKTINRVCGRLCSDNSSNHETTILVEVEQWLLPNHSKSTSSTYLYAIVTIQDFISNDFDIDQCYVSIASNGYIQCRLSYQSSTYQIENIDSMKRIESWKDLYEDGKVNGSIECKFCTNPLFDLKNIIHIQSLPTGQFDNVIHDFICCEDISSNPNKHILTLGDLSTPPGTLLFGLSFLSLSPMDYFSMNKQSNIQPSILSLFECKASMTVLDLYNPEGQSAATSSYYIRSESIEKSTNSHPCFSWPEIIFMESCLISCPRCNMIVGEVVLPNDDSNELISSKDNSNSNSNSNSNNQQSFESEQLLIEDLRDVRLLYHNIQIVRRNSNNNRLQLLLEISVEQILVRTILHINQVKAATIFCLYVKDYKRCLEIDGIEDQSHGADLREVIVLRMINKEYRLAHSDLLNGKESVKLKNAIKISYKIGYWFDICSTQETRIPLQYHEWIEIRKVILERSRLFIDIELFKHQKLSALLQ